MAGPLLHRMTLDVFLRKICKRLCTTFSALVAGRIAAMPGRMKRVLRPGASFGQREMRHDAERQTPQAPLMAIQHNPRFSALRRDANAKSREIAIEVIDLT